MGGDDQHCEGAGADEAGIGESFDLGCGLAAQVNIAQEYRSAPACTTICAGRVHTTEQRPLLDASVGAAISAIGVLETFHIHQRVDWHRRHDYQ